MTQESRDFAATGTLELDEQDHAILMRRSEMLEAHLINEGPLVGDWVEFADGTTRRVSHVWNWPADKDGAAVWSIQTSNGGSFYLGDGCVSFSGGLFMGVPGEEFTYSGETREGAVWFFHHDYATAGGGIDALAPFKVWKCSRDARSI